MCVIDKKEVYKALVKARQEFKGLRATNKSNFGHFSSLVDIQDATQEALLKYELYVHHDVAWHEPTDREVLVTRIVHAESGQEIVDRRFMEYVRPGDQAKGSTQSYMRRYALQALLNLPQRGDDDDGAKQQEYIEAKGLPPVSEPQYKQLLSALEQVPNGAQLSSNICKYNKISTLKDLPQHMFNRVSGYIKKNTSASL